MRRYIALGVAGATALALAGCGGGGSLAASAAEQGNWCNAHTLEPKSSHYAAECAHEERTKTVEQEAKEAEDVLKHRQAEQNANEAERASESGEEGAHK
jgi:hypothetical protein